MFADIEKYTSHWRSCGVLLVAEKMMEIGCKLAENAQK
jgi:hypothetical protein